MTEEVVQADTMATIATTLMARFTACLRRDGDDGDAMAGFAPRNSDCT
jgi:hypothetical protein